LRVEIDAPRQYLKPYLDTILRPAITFIERQMVEMARMIVGEAGRRYPAYNVLLGGWG